MATLTALKHALRQKVTDTTSSLTQPLSNIQYQVGFDHFWQDSKSTTYHDFIIPQLVKQLSPVFEASSHVSVLEIGPGPRSVLEQLPAHMRHKIQNYVAYEPNGVFAKSLEQKLCSEIESPFPYCLDERLDIKRTIFDENIKEHTENGRDQKFDIVLFCHSMYGMKHRNKVIERAVDMLTTRRERGMIVVFHRNHLPDFGDLVCHRTALFPTGTIRVSNKDTALDTFAPFIAGYTLQDTEENETMRVEWRKICRTLGGREEEHPDHLLFSSPDAMVIFNNHATALPELTAGIPQVKETANIKNREARLHRPAAFVRPVCIQQLQRCVQWALKHDVGLTVLGGSHSGHCIWPQVVCVDMSSFNQLNIIQDNNTLLGTSPEHLVVVGTACKTGDIIRETMKENLTVPLGSRPSVGAGLLLQGGIGHLTRQHGLSCDAIVGAIVVSVRSGQILCLGRVPEEHIPIGAMRPRDENELLWAVKGAGTNFGIVFSVTFRAVAARQHSIRSWVVPLENADLARQKLIDFDTLLTKTLPRICSMDAYFYYDGDKMYLGATMFAPSTLTLDLDLLNLTDSVLGAQDNLKVVDGVGLFDADLYVSKIHGGHVSGKTTSFKRCLFLRNFSSKDIVEILTRALKARPTPLCYFHLLHGGGAASDVAAEATAFGCRDWEFACVITGVWPRVKDGSEIARATISWVYKVVRDLLPQSNGVYGADLGPDPRDTMLATKAFGPNLLRLARLKRHWDPQNVLAYTCPLPVVPETPKLIILVTGQHGVGKDYAANIWPSVFDSFTKRSLTTKVASISDVTKKEYAMATGADVKLLNSDREYKEKHRPALTKFYHNQVRIRPRLPEEHFMHIVCDAGAVDVLLITGMRDLAPGTVLAPLVPCSRLIDVHVEANRAVQIERRGGVASDDDDDDNKFLASECKTKDDFSAELDYCHSMIFSNNSTGDEAARNFAEHRLLPFFSEKLLQLENMIRIVPDFPTPEMDFHHILGICQQPGGLALCTSLLQTHFIGNWPEVNAIACCEAGGFIFASALAAQLDVPLALIRNAGKLPPPTISATAFTSHISSTSPAGKEEKTLRMSSDVLVKGDLVVVVDDVLATGQTAYAVLQLLEKSGISAQDITIMVVAEFPSHHGRELLRQRGFGKVRVQSLLVFGGS